MRQTNYAKVMRTFHPTGETFTTAGQWFRTRARGTSLKWEELLNLPLLMFFTLNGILNLPPNLAKVVGDFLTVAFWLGTTIAIVRNKARIHWELWTCRFGFLFLIYILLSMSWGIQPLLNTLYPSITAIFVFFYYNYLIDRFSIDTFTRLMVWAFGIMLTLSVFASVALPSIGIDQGTDDPNNVGAWQGVFGQKNQLGIVATLAIAMAFGLHARNNIDRMWRGLVIIAALLCAYGSQSREAWVAIALQAGALVFIRILRRLQRPSRLPVVLLGCAILSTLALGVYLNLDSVLTLLGRSSTASGRTTIWLASLMLVEKRPWLGYGTYGVWRTPTAWDVVVRAGWNVTSSHNNYIEILLFYGIIGLFFYLLILVPTFIYMFRALMSSRLGEFEVLIYVMIGILVLSMAAPLTLYYPALGMLLLMYCASRLEQIERSGFLKLRK